MVKLGGWKQLTRSGLAVSLVGGIAALWHLSERIRREVLTMPDDDHDYNVEVLDVGEHSISLPPIRVIDTRLDRHEVAALVWPGGFGHLGEVIELTDDSVLRRFTLLEGTRPSVGDLVAVDVYLHRPDPAAVGVAFEDVIVPGPDGALPAWFIDGESGTWIILVHGFEATGRRTMLRYAHMLDSHPRLVISLRNDAGASQVLNRRVGYGTTEWRDVEAAVRYALHQGADNVVLYAISMGGAVALAALLESPFVAEQTIGIVLESPAVDLAEIVRTGSQRMGVPAPLADASMWVAEQRFGFDFGAVDYVQRLRDRPMAVTVPGLILAGDDDQAVPISIIRDLAAQRPNFELVELPDVGHVRGWNVMAEEYERIVEAFVSEL